MPRDPEITALLRRWTAGEKAALDDLVPLVERELRQIARRCLRDEGFPENADRELKQVLRLEFPLAQVSDKQIALWRDSILDLDYDAAIDRFKEPPNEAILVLSSWNE